jgi:glyoxylase-like metal-dependent hydrolase (beta-lactamase superfamily II)
MSQPNYLNLPIPSGPNPTTVTAGIDWLRLPLPFALDHINIWLLRDGAGWVIVDTGFGTQESKSIWLEMGEKRFANEPVNAIVVTHFHPDHIGLADWLGQQFDAETTMTQTEFLMAQSLHAGVGHGNVDEMLGFFRMHGVDQAYLDELEPFYAQGNPYPRGAPSLPKYFQRICDDDELEIGDQTWKVWVGHGHSPEHACLYDEQRGVLISGDLLLPKITSNVSVWPAGREDDPLRWYLDSLDAMAELPDETIVLPSHGQPFTGLRSRITALQEHHDERLGAVLKSCDKPMTGGEVCRVLFKREMDAHQIRFAMGEAVAHLNYLWHADELVRELDNDGIYRFSRS